MKRRMGDNHCAFFKNYGDLENILAWFERDLIKIFKQIEAFCVYLKVS